MAGSILANLIDREYRTKMAFRKQNIKRCSLNINKKCDKCKYKSICEANNMKKQGK